MFKRFRRVRLNPTLRDIVAEYSLSKDDLIYALFIKDGVGVKKEVSSLEGVYQMSIDVAIEEIRELLKLGVKALMLFGIPEVKDSCGSDALSEMGIIAKAIREIKREVPEIFLITDLCFCEYTDHGHCGLIDPKSQSVDNDSTLKLLAKQAVIQAKAGVDMIAPSGMMDGVISSLRRALDKEGFENLPIMSYSTKFASNFYGPFRDVAESTPSFGDRRSYQMSYRNLKEAISESLEDQKEGADILMVKPAMIYLDVVREIKNRINIPLALYNVSGEYAMLKLAKREGILDYERVLMEMMLSFKRAGADLIITYHAKEVAKILDRES